MLCASRNELASIPQGIGQLAALTHLHLAHNFIQTLPLALASLTSLVSLDLNGNPLVSPSVRVVRRGAVGCDD